MHVAVVGAGLSGALAAAYYAKRGHAVRVYEMRRDPRKDHAEAHGAARSINLALSERGIHALRGVGALDAVLVHAVPMRGRMVHARGRRESQPYGVFGETIKSIDRAKLNATLITHAERIGAVFKFDHKLATCDLDARTLRFEGNTHLERFDFLIGADGAYSRVRREIMRRTRMDYAQEYIPHAYVELRIPPMGAQYALQPDHLHVWPREAFMLIALPNTDKSFTATLFMPTEMFDAVLVTREKVLAFFREHFADVVPLIGKDVLVKTVLSSSPGALISIKCSSYHYKAHAVIIGDAAHAMVPFYGQGMNAAFEDVSLLAALPINEPSLALYSAQRARDASVICDLAMHNYGEMRSSVTKRWYRLQRWLERGASALLPHVVIPLYTMVSFTRIPYGAVRERWRAQTRWVARAMAVGAALLGGAACAAILAGALAACRVSAVTWSPPFSLEVRFV